MKEKTFVLIKPDAYIHMGKIISDITSLGFQISKLSMLRLNEQDVKFIYAEHVGRPYYAHIVRHMVSDVIVGIEVAGNGATVSM